MNINPLNLYFKPITNNIGQGHRLHEKSEINLLKRIENCDTFEASTPPRQNFDISKYNFMLDPEKKEIIHEKFEGIEFTNVNAQLADIILSNEKLYNSKNGSVRIGAIMKSAKTPEQAEVAQTILSDENLYGAENVMIHVKEIIQSATSQNIKEKGDIMRLYCSDEKFYNNKNISGRLGEIILSTTPENAQARADIMNLYRFDEKLWGNSNMAQRFGDIIINTNSENVKTKTNIMKLYCSDEKLNNGTAAKYAGDIIRAADTQEREELVKTILSDEKLFNNKNIMDNIWKIICFSSSAENIKAKTDFMNFYCRNEQFGNNWNIEEYLGEIIENIDCNNYELMEQILSTKGLSLKIDDIFTILKSSHGKGGMEYLSQKDLNSVFDALELQKQKALGTPELYVNREFESDNEAKQAVENFFNTNIVNLMVMSSIFDKEAFNGLLRMRFNDAEEYFEIIENFTKEELELIENLSKSCNIDGKPFMPVQKIEFIDLIMAYKENNLSYEKIYSMLENGKIDIGQLNFDLFYAIMKNSGLTEEEIQSVPKEKLFAWDIKYIHLLSKEINEDEDIAFNDLLRAGNLEKDFLQYIHDTNNVYGKANATTKALYEELGLNYDKWLSPSKENKVHFIAKDKNTERLSQIVNQITQDMNVLIKTPAGPFLKKQFPKFIKGDDFFIPNEYSTNKAKLQELLILFTDTSDKGQLSQIWKRAKINSANSNPSKASSAKNTLTVLEHLNQRLEDLSKIQETKTAKTLDLTIKMWDRAPQKDIFQGNYSSCCIAMGGGNGSAMPHYIMNSLYNMIELVDNQTGKTVGNALCYFITDEDNKPAFVIDNVEIMNNIKPSSQTGIQLRNSITQYASNILKEIAPGIEIPIYMGTLYNDIPCEGLNKGEGKISLSGDTDCEKIYMDLYGGWVVKSNYTGKQKFYILK